MDFEIIDFHTHPFTGDENNICSHKEYCNMSIDETVNVFKKMGVTKICGSVISIREAENRCKWDEIKKNNDIALELKNIYGDFYIPGFHIHPSFMEESVNEIERMNKLGVNLIGELVPYMDGWSDYSRSEFSELLNVAGKHNMVVSFHSSGINEIDKIDKMVQNHKDIVFVAAHPGEYSELMRHIERMKMSENYYLDISGTGLFRYGMLRRVIDTVGVERVIFGSDYPTCNTAMFIGGVLLDTLLTDSEKEKIFALNAKRLLNI